MNEMTLVIATGGFDPIHSGHIHYLTDAKKLGDKLIVGVNSDEWLKRKKGAAFMPLWERSLIIQNLKMVDMVISFDDSDETANDAIWRVKQMFPQRKKIVFVNGGDRNQHNTPEMIWDDVEFIFGIGGFDKLNSSSIILKNWKEHA